MHAGREVVYIEATVADVALANRLAAEVLGRSLDELAPQTRRLLEVLDTMVAAVARDRHMERAEVRFSRRDVREHSAWGDTQLKVHLARLVELELVVVHKGGRGQSSSTSWPGTAPAATAARSSPASSTRPPSWPTAATTRSGRVPTAAGRGPVGPWSGAGRGLVAASGTRRTGRPAGTRQATVAAKAKNPRRRTTRHRSS
ncbi:MAG: hypothetical protein ACRD0D_01585 [Acidimicrobiales bacterium]